MPRAKDPRRLQTQGVVLVERVGDTNAYRLNAAHLAAEPITALAKLFSTFLEKLETTLEGWEQPPVYAAMFGSAVRGTMSTDSDLDLLLVSEEPTARWARQVADLAVAVTSWTGNGARLVEYAVAELQAAQSEPMF